jgi:thiamine-phosphate pyrophosphorylase
VTRVPWLYAIVDLEACAQRGVEPLVHTERCLARGATWVQLRAKPGTDDDHRALAAAMLARCDDSGATFVVNDRLALARAIGARCVHVGQGDAGALAIRAADPALRFGRSTHDRAELRRALEESPAYVAFGPVFATASKRNPEPVVGLDGLAEAHRAARAAGVPLVAIGGIDAANLAAVRAHGDAVALISALLPRAGESVDAPFARLGLSS